MDCVKTISLKNIRETARKEGISVQEVESKLLENNRTPARYLRNIGTFGLEGQRKLLGSSAAVIGCGGLGGWIVELLARAGVGKLVVVDGDVFEDSNLNRQLLCTEATLGQNKASAAAARVRVLNGAIVAEAHSVMLNEGNALEILKGCDIVFDALDGIPARKILLAAAQALKIPMVHGAIAGFWGQVHTALPEDTTLNALWENAQEKGIEKATGNPPFTPSLIASLQVCEGLKLLMAGEDPVQKKPLWIDLKDMSIERIG